jgi:uncharacterized protein YoxC
MVKFRHLLAAILICLTLATVCALAQSSLTQIRDTITNSDGTPFNGMVVITWNGFSVPSGTPVSQLSASARIYNGALSVLLVPTTTATAGTYYQVVYSSSDGTVTWTETWQVPPSTTALTIAQVRQSTTQGSGGTTTGGGGNYATLPISISEVTGLSTDLANLNSSVSTLNTQVAALPTSAAFTALQSTVSGLTTTVNGLTTTVNGLSTTVAGHTTSIASLNSTVGSLSTTVSGLSTSLTNLTNTVTALTATVNSLSGGNSSSVYVDSQTPTGTLNGTNKTFNLASAPSPSSSLALYRNGLLQSVGVDYSLSGAGVTFTTASTPLSTDLLQAFYRIVGSGTSSTIVDAETPSGTINGTNLAFTLVNTPIGSTSVKLYKNGLLLSQNGDYTMSGKTITFTSTTTTPQTGDALVASYRY